MITPKGGHDIAAVILAAGESRRMGGLNKLLIEVESKPIVTRVADAVLASRATLIIVVTGYEAEIIVTALRGRRLSFVHNPDFSTGLSSSLRHGINALPPSVAGAVICLGDMPWLTGRHIDKLISAFASQTIGKICVPVYQGRRGNPVLFDRCYFPEMATVQGDKGARHVIERHAGVVQKVEMDDDALFRDVDVPADLEP